MPHRLIALTGATGFVGRHVVDRLLEEDGLRLRCLVRPGSDDAHLRSRGDRVTRVEGDVTRADTLPALVEGAWGVVNLAGHRDFWSRSRERYYELNEGGARNVFEASLEAGVAKVVQVSTPLAFGAARPLPFDEDSPAGPHPSDYARSKHRGDEHGWRLHRERGLPLTAVHLAAVIGAGDPRPTMEIRRAMDRRLPALVGARRTYTYVHVLDAAEAIVRAMLRAGTVGRRYLIGTERATTRGYFESIGEVAGVPVPRRDLPEAALLPLARVMERVASWTGRRPPLPVDILTTSAAGSLTFDGTRAIRELGMTYRPLRSAIADAVAEIRAGTTA